MKGYAPRRSRAWLPTSLPLPRGAVGMGRELRDESRRVRTLCEIVIHLPLSVRAEAFAEALDTITAIENWVDPPRLLTRLVPHLVKLPRPVLFSLWNRV